MTNKVKVTAEQKKMLDTFQETVNETGISTEAFIYAFQNGYVVEPKFKVGDWVAYVHDNTIWEVIGELYGGKVHYDITRNGRHKGSVHKDHIRLATPSEIKQEKERRFWNKNNRDVWELRKGDILRRESDKYTVEVSGVHFDDKTVIFENNDWEYYENAIEEYKVACFNKDRLDGKTDGTTV